VEGIWFQFEDESIIPPARFKLRTHYSFLVNFSACSIIWHMCTVYVLSASSSGALALMG
jgi:hypothetical protein